MSPHETPATVLIEEHYARLNLHKGWNNERVNRLCHALHVTPHELGKLCCISFKQMSRMITANYFPPTIALHFALIENWYVQAVSKSVRLPIVPIHLLA